MESIDELKGLRKKAEDAVAEMPNGELKTKAFEVILQHLLSTRTSIPITAPTAKHEKGDKAETSKRSAVTMPSRILLLKDEGFFKTPRSLSEIQAELKVHGWYIELPPLGTAVLRLVRETHLRRIKEQAGRTKLWKYVNP